MALALHKFSSFGASIFTGRLIFQALYSDSSSSKRWVERQARDSYTNEAKLRQYKSRAVFKLLQIDHKYKIFKPGQTVVDLGCAPGSWSQVAIDRVVPDGRVLGVDIIPIAPPEGVSTIQGNFLSPTVQNQIRELLARSEDKRNIQQQISPPNTEILGSIDHERHETMRAERAEAIERGEMSKSEKDKNRMIDLVLSDMCDIDWPLCLSYNSKSLTMQYNLAKNRLKNTSGIPLRDHVASMTLCDAALMFCTENLKPGGHFICKFYQGSDDKILESRISQVFQKVSRVKPDSSRKESKENYFVAKGMKSGVTQETLDYWLTNPSDADDSQTVV